MKGWKELDSQRVMTGPQPTVVFNSIPFSDYKLIRLDGMVDPYDITNGLYLSGMRFNGDSGANYNYISASFSTTYNSTTEAGANYMGTGPGFNHGESVLYTIYIAQFPTMVHVRSHSYTNGSGVGDAHIFTGNYTGGSSITSIELAGNYPGVLTANAAHDAGNRWSLSVIR